MADNGTVVELRVHGVSGTPPEAMLGCPTELITQKAGDNSAGFYRRKDWVETAVAAAATNVEPGRWRSVMEAYSWGGLTSGRASRALWLLFLPFIFINLAHWMLPPAATNRRAAAAISVGLLRLIALSLTLTLMLATAVAVMDLIGWQCLNLDSCSDQWGPLALLAKLPRGTQIALSAVPLVIVIAVLWLLGREDLRFAGKPPPSPAVTKDDVPLMNRTFWNPDFSVQRLRACHVMAWTAGLAALTLAVPVRHAVSADVRAVSLGLLEVNGVLLAIAVAMTAWNPATARGGPSADRLTPPLLALRWLSLGLLAASLIWVAVAKVDYSSAPTQLPGLRGAIYVMLGVQVVLLILLLSFGARCQGPESSPPAGYAPSLGGLAAWFVALIGWLIAGGFSLGIGLWTAQLLGTPVISTALAIRCQTDIPASDGACVAPALNAEPPLIVPPPYIGFAVAIAALIIVAILAGLFVWGWVTAKTTRVELQEVRNDYTDQQYDPVRAEQVAESRAWALLPDHSVQIVAVLALVAVAEMAGLAAWYVIDPGWFDAKGWLPSAVITVSVFITSSLAAGLVLLAVLAYRNRNLRRLVAVLWDIATFWPRANHPLTPPSYGGRTVYELLVRLQTLHDETNTRVVFAAHSQGSIIAAATLLHDNGEARERVALLTFGSPLRRLYAKNFPAYFGPKAIGRLRDPQPAAWINLWAHSDPVGGWVTETSLVFTKPDANDENDPEMLASLERVDIRLLDVEADLRMSPDGSYHPICGHSGFWIRPEYNAALTTLGDRLTPQGIKTDTSATAPPTEEMV
jgi:hypothetical protein